MWQGTLLGGGPQDELPLPQHRSTKAFEILAVCDRKGWVVGRVWHVDTDRVMRVRERDVCRTVHVLALETQRREILPSKRHAWVPLVMNRGVLLGAVLALTREGGGRERRGSRFYDNPAICSIAATAGSIDAPLGRSYA